MSKDTQVRVADLLARLARVSASDEWSEDMNPAQRTALTYLSRANRFSCAPSHVADYLRTTRGTASQTLKSLERKGFIHPIRSKTDKRSISYEVTDKGEAVARAAGLLDDSLDQMNQADLATLEALLEDVMTEALRLCDSRSFGVCGTCRHHRENAGRRRCSLLSVSISDTEAKRLCHEHAFPISRQSAPE